MTSCVHCKTRLSWFFIFKKLIIIKSSDIPCPSCRQSLYFTSRSKRMLVGVTTLLPLFFVLLFMLGYVPLFLVLVMGYMLVLPWLVDVTGQDEPLF